MRAVNGMEARMSTSAPARASIGVERLAEQVREASAERRPLRIVGAGTWTHAAPADATAELSTRELDQVIEYVPGDLTMTVGAGMSLSAIEKLTGEHGQWLTLDPFGSPDGTIGATTATASSGPLATGFGVPRDLMLGVEAVTGMGNVVRAGGRVVKNVAGFDITRLLTGSRGTIGVITEVSLRLRARPAIDETLIVAIGAKSSVRELLGALRGWTSTPMAAELLAPRTAGELGLPAVLTLMLRIGGNTRLVTAVKKRAAAIGKVDVGNKDVWGRLRALDLATPVSFRVGDLPSAFPERWDDALALAGDAGHLIGAPLRGQIRCLVPAVDRASMNAFRARAQSATLVYDALSSAATWNSLTAVPAATTLHARIMEAFDPVGIMNPGAMRLAR
jgi:glycolate oxidase FAD binding subunit